jgi:flagellar hook-associated protein 3 FlgL
VFVDPNYVSHLVTAVNQSSGAEAKLTAELSSGLSVTSLEDNPTAVAQSVQLGSSIAVDDTFVQTASSEQSQLQVADSALGEVVTQVTSALSLAVQGSSGGLSASNLATIGQQLVGIRDQVLSLANSSYQGEYVFGGSVGSTAPFSIDSTTTPATVTYSGDSSVQSISTPDGQKIQVNLPGSSVFGTSSSGLLQSLNQLIADFSGGSASATVTADTAGLTTSLTQLSQQRSVLDSSLSRIESTSTYTQTQEAQLTVAQSSLVAADPATVASQLSSAETQHQALLSVMSALGSEDLFKLIN